MRVREEGRGGVEEEGRGRGGEEREFPQIRF